MSFSALILTYNETDSLLECARSVLRLEECAELVVFQNFGYNDQAPVLSDIKALCSERNIPFHQLRSDCDVSPAVAINQALETLQHDTLLFIQAGCSIEPNSKWTDVESAFAQDSRCQVVGFPILSGNTLKGVSPFFSPSGHRLSEGGYVGQNASNLDSKGTFPIPEPMPQAFALRKHSTQLDTSSWYNFELTSLTLSRPVYCCSAFRVQHKDQGIRRNRAACSNEWKRREAIGAEALKHHLGTPSNMGFEWALIRRYTLPYLGQPRTPDAVARNTVLQLSFIIALGAFFALLFLPIFLSIGIAILTLFLARTLLWSGLKFLGR